MRNKKHRLNIVSPEENAARYHLTHQPTVIDINQLYLDTKQHFCKKAEEYQGSSRPKPMYVEESFRETLAYQYGDHRRVLSMQVELNEDTLYKVGYCYQCHPTLRVAIREYVDPDICPTIQSTDFTEYIYPRNAGTPTEMAELDGLEVEDIIVRYGLNRRTGEYSYIGKWVSLVLKDGRHIKLHGEKLPSERWGDERDELMPPNLKPLVDEDHLEDDDYYYEEEQPTWEQVYGDWSDDWEEMAEEGAQFSWMDY